MPASPYYITTPIYYVNDRPHIGHCYTSTIADIAARFQRLLRGTPGDVFFLTGTDEHADKVVTSAVEHGASAQEWADRNAAEFARAFESFNLSNDDFIRTTQPRHKDKVVQYIGRLLKSGDIYKGEYTGWYDPGQEEYVTENAAREASFKSVISGKALIKRTEPCYFFRLSAYQARLKSHIDTNPRFIQPDSRRSEVLGRLNQGLNDIPVSRPVTDDPATKWGIRIPGDEAHRIYVWIDALFNYLSVVDTPERRRFWPAAVHLIGKDILWFHAVIWPALLMALNEPLPGMIFGHGWWISEGMKMSKSLGNFISLERIQAYSARYSLDAVRWYLATQGPLGGSDADFVHAKFVEVYNSDLANGIGNCASRVGNMIEKYFGGAIPATRANCNFARSTGANTPLDLALAAREKAGNPVATGHEGRPFDFPKSAEAALRNTIETLDRFDVFAAVFTGRDLVREIDEFIAHTAPFTLAKQLDANPGNRDALANVLFACAEALRIASLLLSPTMPQKMAQLWAAWNCAPPADIPLAELAQFAGPHGLKPGHKISKGEGLFMRADPAEAAPGA